MVKKCSRLQYLRFLLTLSSTGLSAGEHGFFTVVPAQAVHVEPVGPRQSRWNLDGELLRHNHITAEGGACRAAPNAATCLVLVKLSFSSPERCCRPASTY
jgi:hypothetical protein